MKTAVLDDAGSGQIPRKGAPPTDREKMIEEIERIGWGDDLGQYNEASKAVVKQKATEIAEATLAVAERRLDERERREPVGCPTPGACSCVRSEAKIGLGDRIDFVAAVDRCEGPDVRPVWLQLDQATTIIPLGLLRRVAAAIRARSTP